METKLKKRIKSLIEWKMEEYQFLEIVSDVGVDHNMVEGFGTILVHPQHQVRVGCGTLCVSSLISLLRSEKGIEHHTLKWREDEENIYRSPLFIYLFITYLR